MAMFKKIKGVFSGKDKDLSGEEYLEIDLEQEKKENKVLVKLFSLNDYDEANNVLNTLRDGYTIAVIDIRNLRKKDPIELKRAVSKIKKTIDAIGGNIAGFGENTVIATPSFAKIDKDVAKPKQEDPRKSFLDTY